MQIARVIGTVVATQKHPSHTGCKALLVQPLQLDGSNRGEAVVAFGSAGNPYDALVQLNGSIAAGKWKPDGFAKRVGIAPGQLHQDVIAKTRGDTSP